MAPARVPQHHIFPSRRNVQSFIESHASLFAAAFQRAEGEYPKRGERYSEQAPSTSQLPERCLCCCYHKCGLFSACGLFCSQHLSDAYKFSSSVMSEVTRIKLHHQLWFNSGKVLAFLPLAVLAPVSQAGCSDAPEYDGSSLGQLIPG